MTFFFDLNEPTTILDLVKPHTLVTVGAYNAQGHSDYHWQDSSGKWIEVERKTYGEVFADIHAVEAQMFEHLTLFPTRYHVFLLEGLAVPSWKGMTILKNTKNGIYVKGYESPRNIKGIWSKLYSMSRSVDIIPSPSQEASASILLAMYENDKKAEHTTFNRNYARPTYKPNPVVSKLMGMYPGVGETIATALAYEFSTIWNIINATVEDIAKVKLAVTEKGTQRSVGPVLARRILKEVGRPDVV